MSNTTLSASPIQADNTKNWHVAALLIFMFGNYTLIHIQLNTGQIVFPFALSGVIGLIAFSNYYIKNWITLNELLILTVFFTFFLIYYVMSVIGDYSAQYMHSMYQLLYSLVVCFGMLSVIVEIPKLRLYRLFRNLAYGFLLIAILEAYIIDWSVMENIYDALYSWRYQNYRRFITRDLSNWGHIRPLVFSTEPSHAGVWSSILIICATILSPSPNWRRYLIFLIYICVSFYVMRSTAALPIIFGYAVSLFFNKSISIFQLTIIWGIALILYILFLLSFFSDSILFYILNDASAFIRLIAPLFALEHFIKEYPLFGIGLGNEELIIAYTADIYSRFIEISFILNLLIDNQIYFTNNLARYIIYYGLVGGTIFMLAITSWVRRIGKFQIIPIIIQTCGVWITMDGGVTVRVWFFVFLLIACSIIVEKSHATTEGNSLKHPA